MDSTNKKQKFETCKADEVLNILESDDHYMPAKIVQQWNKDKGLCILIL